MESGAFGERLNELAGPEFLSQRPDFDPHNAIHVDQACQLLLQRFYAENDGRCFELMTTLAEPHLIAMVEKSQSAHGMLLEPRQIVSEWLSLLFVDLNPQIEVPPHILAVAQEWCEANVQRVIQELAARPLPHEDGYDDWCNTDEAQIAHRLAENEHGSKPGLEPLADPRYMDATSVAFHRMDLISRQVMRAMDVDLRLPEDIAEWLGISEKRVLQTMKAARASLLNATLRIDGGHDHE